MNKIVAAIVFAVVTGGMYFLCANAHIDIFPCERAERAFGSPGDLGPEPPLRERDGSCSLLAHNRGTNSRGEYSRLTDEGWTMLWAFCGGIGLVSGIAVGLVTRKRSAA